MQRPSHRTECVVEGGRVLWLQTSARSLQEDHGPSLEQTTSLAQVVPNPILSRTIAVIYSLVALGSAPVY